jgi:hypothetical protein
MYTQSIKHMTTHSVKVSLIRSSPAYRKNMSLEVDNSMPGFRHHDEVQQTAVN